tara:strand:- start:716 stop:1357 length:642 start_codon:yes stop_codon:yes gene_type:complete
MIALTNPIFNQDIIFILLTISFLIIAILKAYYWKHTKLLLMGVFAQRYANQFLREENVFTQRVNFMTFFLMIINFSVIILKFIPKASILEVLALIVFAGFFFVIKIGLMLLLGSIFRMKDMARLGIFFSFLFDRSLGFFLFPFIVALYFFPFDISSILLFVISSITAILLALKLFWLWKIGTKSFGFPNSYIFLYLCMLEISPLLLLGKGVVY